MSDTPVPVGTNLFTIENIKNAGIAGLLVIIIVTGATGWWVFGPTYTNAVTSYEKRLSDARADCEKNLGDVKNDYEKRLTAEVAEKNEWKSTALNGLKVAKQISPYPVAVGAAPTPNVSAKTIAAQLENIRKQNINEK